MPDRAFLTPAGKTSLETELRQLKHERRPEIAEKIHRAKEFGEMPEGGEFDESKNEQSFVEGRIAEIEDLLKNARIIEQHDRNVVSVGGFVKVKDEGGSEEVFNIVGAAEIEPTSGKVSNESPFAVAVLGKRVGDQAVVRAPGGAFSYTVLEIW